jgi:hypothetical protein
VIAISTGVANPIAMMLQRYNWPFSMRHIVNLGEKDASAVCAKNRIRNMDRKEN